MNLGHFDDDEDISIMDHNIPSTNPFDKISDKGKLYETHSQIIQLQDQIMNSHYKMADYGFI